MENLNVLITGASGGIGRELARAFASKNNHVILVARNEARLEELRAELSALGRVVTVIPKDLTEPGAALDVYDTLERQGVQVHVLVNNAGSGMYGSLEDLSLERQLRMIQLNLAALTELTHRFAQRMVERRFGRILNVGSISSFLPTPMMSVYAATKAYVLSFSEALDAELRGKGDISVTALCPGFTDTTFIRELNMGPLERLVARIAMQPADVARCGYEALRTKKAVAVAGRLNASLLCLCRLLPRAWVRRCMAAIFREAPVRRSDRSAPGA
ncbi:SDR family oxidoreductase [Paenibacillus sp.]|uniref:SDR family NAD(P)-dependent oxidoreductase n=1 Tax=Paenibacillus sp. TaxID=58172 RepID=UPI002D505B5B|nr:SDR family oxidoreductase [Paenibacillus sp.]HZG86331.1 SDR family oxidoreductase [Paenibacillus sp.]